VADPQFPPKWDEVLVNRFLDSIDGEAESSRREIQKSWEENIRQVRGDQWRLQRSPYFLANIIKNQVRRKVASLTEGKLQFHVGALRPDLDKASQIIYQTIKSVLDRSSIEDVNWRLGQFAMTLGSAFVGSSYDSTTNEIGVPFIDPRRVWLDPGLSSPEEMDQAQYVRIDTVLPLADIRRRFPGRGLLVKPSDRYSSYVEGSLRSKTTILGSVLQAMPRPYRPGTPTKAGPIPRAELREYWVRDPQINDDGSLKFPGGRHLIRSGSVLLLDEANPYWDGGWPIDMLVWDIEYDQAWGQDEVQDLRRIQEAINRSGDAWILNLLLGSNFKIIADSDALDPDQWEKLDSEAGLIIRKRPNRSLEYQAPVAPSDVIPGALSGLIQLTDLLTGNVDRGGADSPARASSALEGLQLAKQTLIRAVARRMETMWERMGQKLISRVFQFYTSDKVLYQQGPSREWVSYTFERQKLLMDDKGRTRPAEERQQMFKDFKFMVTPGSSLAQTRIQRTMAALQLRSATGFVPSVRRILEEADLGNAEELIREGLEELKTLPPPPPVKGRGGRS